MKHKQSAPQRPALTLFPDWCWEMHCVAAFTAMIVGGSLGAWFWDVRGAFLVGWALVLAAKYLLIALIRFVLWLSYPRRMARRRGRQRKNGMVSGYIAVLAMFSVFIGLPVGAQWLAAALGIGRIWGILLGILLAVPAQLLLHAVLYFFQWLFILKKQPWNKK